LTIIIIKAYSRSYEKHDGIFLPLLRPYWSSRSNGVRRYLRFCFTGKTAPETLSVVVTTTILGSVVRDIVTCVAGDDAGLSVIMPIGVDPHDFQASSEQVALMVGADLTVVNGLGLEAGLVSTFETLSAEGNPIYEVAAEVNPLPFGRSDDDHAGEEKRATTMRAMTTLGRKKRAMTTLTKTNTAMAASTLTSGSTWTGWQQLPNSSECASAQWVVNSM